MSNNYPPTINHTIHCNWQTSQFINPAKLVHSLSVHNDNLPTDENKKCNLHNVKANYIFSSHQLVKVSFLNKTQLVSGQVPRVSRPTRWSWLIFGSVMITDNRETGYSNVLRFPDRRNFVFVFVQFFRDKSLDIKGLVLDLQQHRKWTIPQQLYLHSSLNHALAALQLYLFRRICIFQVILF